MHFKYKTLHNQTLLILLGKKITIAITGANGFINTKRLLERLHIIKNQTDTCDLVFSFTTHEIWKY